MQPAQTPPVAPAAVPAAVPKKVPIDMSALKMKVPASVARTLAVAGVLAQRPRPSPEAAEDALLGLAPMRPAAAGPAKVPVAAPPRKTVPPPKKVRKVERSSSTSSSSAGSSASSSGSSSDSSSEEDSSSSSDDGTASEVSAREATLFDIAQSQGLVNKDALTQEEEEAPASLVPPRPPVVRSFPSDIAKTLERYRERLNREESIIRIKDDNKAVSLGTSKINYIDPRIVCSWAKAHDVPINKVFSATIVKKFPWAMNVENFDF